MIAINLGLLAAGFNVTAEYLSDVWPEAEAAQAWFVGPALVALRDDMVASVQEQAPSQVFWSTLRALIACGHVRVDTFLGTPSHIAAIGKELQQSPGMCTISTALALGEVNASLRKQGKPELKITIANLLEQLSRDGLLFDREGNQIGPADASTVQVRIDRKPCRSFITRKELVTPGPNDLMM